MSKDTPRVVTTRELAEAMLDPRHGVAWLVGVILSRPLGNAPRTTAFLTLAQEAAKDELDPPDA